MVNRGISLIVMVLVFGIGLMIGYYAGSNTITASDVVTQAEEMTTGNETKVTTQTATTSHTEEKVVGTQAQAAEATTVHTSQLTPSQRRLLETLGVDTDSIIITPAMIACAEAKVGAARLAAIQGGATPSFMEGASLMACYKS